MKSSHRYGRICTDEQTLFQRFAVDQNNGTISVASKLDFESKPSYSIKLEAKDGGNKITEVSVMIMITDDNDNRPIFDPPGTTTASLDENQDSGFFVAVKVGFASLNIFKLQLERNLTQPDQGEASDIKLD